MWLHILIQIINYIHCGSHLLTFNSISHSPAVNLTVCLWSSNTKT